jgi:hypothetical protein
MDTPETIDSAFIIEHNLLENYDTTGKYINQNIING